MPIKLSIITINYNNFDGFRKTLESVIFQTFKDYEYIVIDGGSTDGSVEVIKEYADKITYWVSETDSGIYNAMNKGIIKAKGEYCFFLNSGDSLLNNNIISEVFSQAFQEDILYGNMQNSRNGNFITVAEPAPIITMRTLFEDTIHHQAAFIKRSLFERFGGYNEDYSIRADWEFWIRAIITHNCSTRYINLVISDYDADGISALPSSQGKKDKETAKILKTILPEKIIEDYVEMIELNKKYTLVLDEVNRYKHRFAGLDKFYTILKKSLKSLRLIRI